MAYSSFFRTAAAGLLILIAVITAAAADRSESDDRGTSSKSSSTKRSTDQNDKTKSADFPATDPDYRLTIGDEIAITVYNEPDLSSVQQIDNKGCVRLYPQEIGNVDLANKSVREAETFLEKLYIDKKLLVRPMVSVNVHEYSPREALVVGAVNGPGKYHFLKDKASVEIVELITSMGGLRPTAVGDDVKVTHTDDSGKETTNSVNVESMLTGRGANRNTPKSFLVYPGDRIYIRERLF